MSAAYYNEVDPFAAAWLEELIRAGHIAPGEVDTRSIEDVLPADLAGFGQCHFFAGIGVWSHALRCAGWPADRPVWTGSCPCQPFSAAGKGGGFADERHLWPAFHHLIRQCRPAIVFGEQVASRDGLAWFDLVQTDMEAAGYACGAVDTCAAGFGAPHIRQRLYWVAHAESSRSRAGFCDPYQEGQWRHVITDGSTACGMGNAISAGLEGYAGHGDGKIGRQGQTGSASAPSGACRLELSCHERRERGQASAPGYDTDRASPRRAESEYGAGLAGAYRLSEHGTGPTDGRWRLADWLLCRDGKWRPVEPGTFPLAHGIANRVGRLCGYGNAIVAPQAEAFIRAAMDILGV